MFGLAPIKLSELAAFKKFFSFRGLNSTRELLLAKYSLGGLAGSSGLGGSGSGAELVVYLLSRGRKRELLLGLVLGGADLGSAGGDCSFCKAVAAAAAVSFFKSLLKRLSFKSLLERLSLDSLLKRLSFSFRLMKDELGLSITFGFALGDDDSLLFSGTGLLIAPLDSLFPFGTWNK